MKDFIASLLDRFTSYMPEKVEALSGLYNTKVYYNDRMRSVVGYARYSDMSITLNNRAMQLYPEELKPTVAHELGHLIAYRLHNITGHGKIWKNIMIILGYDNSRCVNLNLSSIVRRQKPVAKAYCHCDIHELKRRRYENMVRGVGYRCKACKGKLVLY